MLVALVVVVTEAAAAVGCGLDLPGSSGACWTRAGDVFLAERRGRLRRGPVPREGARGRVRRHIQKCAWAGGWFRA